MATIPTGEVLQARRPAWPSPPASLVLIVRAAGDSRVSLQQLARMVTREPTFTAELLRVANSPAFGLVSAVRSAKQATVVLGARQIRNMAVMHAMRVMSENMDVGAFDVDAFWEHSLRRAIATRLVAERVGFRDPLEAFTVGLIMDLGTLAMAAARPGDGELLQRFSTYPADRRLELERQLTGRDHAEVFVELARAWAIPEDMVDAVRGHHQRVTGRGDLADCVRLGDLLADVYQARAVDAARDAAEDGLCALPIGEPMGKLLSRVRIELLRDGKELGFAVAEQPSARELLQLAAKAMLQIQSGYEALAQNLELQLRDRVLEDQQEGRRNVLRLAMTDELTGVANRRHFTTLLDQAVQHARQGIPLALLVLDLDSFRKVNDAHGQAAGDQVLRQVTSRMSELLRGGDAIARLGGEEFAVLLPGAPAAVGRRVAERLRRALCDLPMSVEEGSVTVTASFGGIAIASGTGLSGESLLRRADAALYASKSRGGNRVTWTG